MLLLIIKTNCQYTSEIFVKVELSAGIKLSMDGKGRATDNAFIERLGRSVKYEKVYLTPPVDGKHLDLMMKEHFEYYNNQRRHISIEDENQWKNILLFSQSYPLRKRLNRILN